MISAHNVDFTLFWIFLIFSLICGFQLARIIYNKHNIYSSQFGFLLLCFIGAFVRGFYFLYLDYWNHYVWVDILLYWIPESIQFSTFSFLVLYYASTVHKQNWSYYRKYFVLAFGALSVGFLIFGIAIAIIEGTKGGGKEPLAGVELCRKLFSAIMFFILVLVLAVYGWLFSRAVSAPTPAKVAGKGISLTGIRVVTVLAFLIFASRSTYNFINLSGRFDIHLTSASTQDHILILALLCTWELLPSALVVALFWRIPKSNIAMVVPGVLNPTYSRIGLNRETSLIGSGLFSNPGRYDSDDEKTPFKPHHSPLYSGYGTSAYSPYLTTYTPPSQ